LRSISGAGAVVEKKKRCLVKRRSEATSIWGKKKWNSVLPRPENGQKGNLNTQTAMGHRTSGSWKPTE
jgi:hypothetical protein